jgi:transposase InsO family protein
VSDLHSRQISLVDDALLMAVWKRKPLESLIWHTDRYSQYASDSHRALLKENGISQSKSRKGNCWDNAVSKSFFHTLKSELIHHQHYQTRAETKQNIFEYIEVFYNQEILAAHRLRNAVNISLTLCPEKC